MVEVTIIIKLCAFSKCIMWISNENVFYIESRKPIFGLYFTNICQFYFYNINVTSNKLYITFWTWNHDLVKVIPICTGLQIMWYKFVKMLHPQNIQTV